MTGVCGRRLLVRFLTRVVWTRAIGRGDALAAGQRAGRAGCVEQRAGGRAGGGAGPRSPCLAASFFVFGNSEWEWRVPPSKEGAVTQDPLGSGTWPLRGTRCSPAGPG